MSHHSPDNSDWLAADSRTVWHPFTPSPHLGPKRLITRAEGAYLFDEEGQRLLDGTSSWWCNIHGHCHPRLVKALSDQAGILDQMLFAPHAHPTALELSEKLVKLVPGMSRVFYSDDGSTAVEAAIKMAWQYWQRRGEDRTEFVSLGGAYHGDTLGAASLGGIEKYRASLSMLKTRTAAAPDCYRCPVGKSYPECDIACLESLKKQLDENLAALVIEPLVMGAAGMVIYPREYLSSAMRLARDAGALVIVDEVFTGFGRTGSLFAIEGMTEMADIVCLSKGLTAGVLPMGATLVTDQVYGEFCGPGRTFYHGHTFTANALGCAVALESLKIFEEDQVLKRNIPLIEILRNSLPRFRALARVGDARSLGMIWAVDCVDALTRQPLASEALWAVVGRLWERGLWVRPLHSVLYLVPPYCVTAEELNESLDLISEELK
ncbi:MAG: adenosylmethionine--8-amino-7-oxononanoate transaminase [Deltaproteobacteria bacterium]|nr:adenosylmethionine--8-amino-7-oxononanoate transaminase [Deltaproteobacteria bacterium]MBI3294508.1 adenosylmethionine--8-amino-7-oxononanoate transaminase [Deltaproteobacteria bacterium]